MKSLKLLVVFLLFSVLAVAQKAELVVPSFHTSKLSVFKISNNSKYLLTGSGDNMLKIWDYKKGKELKSFLLEDDVRSGFFSANGRYVIANDNNHFIVIDLTSLKIVHNYKFPKGAFIYPMTLGRTEGTVLFGYYNHAEKQLQIYEVHFDGTQKQLIYSKPSDTYLQFDKIETSPNLKHVFIGSKLGNFILDLKTLTSKPAMEGAQFFLPNNSLVILNKARNTLSALNLSTDTYHWQQNITDIIINPKRELHNEFFIDPMAKTLSYSQTCDFEENLTVVNWETGTKKEYSNFEANLKFTNLASVGDELLAVTYEPKTLKILEKSTRNLKREFGKAIFSPQFLEGSPQANMLAVGGFYNNELKTINFESGKINLTTFSTDESNPIIRMSNDGKTIASGSEYLKTHINLIVNNTLKKIPLPQKGDVLMDMALSGDGSKLGVFKRGFVMVVDTKTGATLFSDDFADEVEADSNGKIVFSDNDKFLVSYILKDSKDDEKDEVRCYSSNSSKRLWKKKMYFQHYAFQDEKTIIATESINNNKQNINAENGRIVKTEPIANLEFTSNDASYNQEFSQLAIEDKLNILIYDLKKGTKKGELVGSVANVYDVSFYKNDFLFSCGSDNVIYLWDTETMKLLAKIVVYAQTKDWALVTPDGLFDGSQDAIKDMYFVKGEEFIPLEQLYEKFYTPNLLARLLAREIVPKKVENNINDLAPPPKVKIKYQSNQRNLSVEDDETINTSIKEAIITITAEGIQSDIQEIRLYHNGKLITNNSRNLTVEDDQITNNSEKTYQINLVSGENMFKAIALNSQRTESAPAEVTVIYKQPIEVVKPEGIQLHMVVIGINEYKNPKYNLNYAVADAMGFENAIKNGMSSITSKVNITFIKNNEADRNNIYSKLQEIANNANPQDIFIFYYAGHGMMSQETNPDFYLVPYDVTQIYGDDGGIKKKGISASELKQIASTIKAQKQLYVLDACQSAGALSTVAARGAAEEKAIAQLARSTGTHWLTASGSQQVATEFDQLGHGIFTYVFLDALKGKADSGDGKITVNEIKAYLESEVPELSKKYNGSPQYPSSFGFGQDFPVGVKH